ncbi:hypothetical protein [Candidatus Korarchaeum cryptofilum]|uniref:DUF4064 domain-containing protein n=1 Tax=Korarchaeum cryptofilum (strain OPF8) TaxID=374847 RepID=B1L678_KORCO|nr:hypothetical protein [Candidatus Korarchaeum cryptofilum]ACB07957.1 hypothetical protein Kcr_1211 [Candidatus Korarchaeum cryptofilum OPF8]
MKLRLGILISGVVTAAISIILIYLSIVFSMKTQLSYLGILVGLILAALALGALLNKGFAVRVLSIFYLILALSGILIMVSLPPEGLLITLPSLALGSYLWRSMKKVSEGSETENFTVEGAYAGED